MKPTIDFLQHYFDTFNTQMFEGRLPHVPIELGSARRSLGSCRFQIRHSLFGRQKRTDFRLRFSTFYDLSQAEWEDTLLHEMIHLYIGVSGKKDSSPHGILFRQMQQHLNQNYGRHITISHRSTPEQTTRQDEGQSPHSRSRRFYVVALVVMRDGRRGVKVLPHTRQSIRKYQNLVSRSPETTSIQLFTTTNPFFGRYPSSSAPKVYFLDPQILEQELSAALPLTV